MNDVENALDKDMPVAPGGEDVERDSGTYRADAGSDRSIEKRLEKNPESSQARLDRGLDESMDASDPPASTQPVHNNAPAPSSGYDEAAEKARAEGGN